MWTCKVLVVRMSVHCMLNRPSKTVIWGTTLSPAEFLPGSNETELQKDLISSVIGLGKTGSPQQNIHACIGNPVSALLTTLADWVESCSVSVRQSCTMPCYLLTLSFSNTWLKMQVYNCVRARTRTHTHTLAFLYHNYERMHYFEIREKGWGKGGWGSTLTQKIITERTVEREH